MTTTATKATNAAPINTGHDTIAETIPPNAGNKVPVIQGITPASALGSKLLTPF